MVQHPSGLKVTKLFNMEEFSGAKHSGKDFIIITTLFLIIIMLQIIIKYYYYILIIFFT